MLALNHRVGEGLSLTDAEWSAWRTWATSSSSSAGKRRKRKKRRKKKAPKTSSSRSSGMRLRRCGHGRALFLRGSVSVCSLAYCRSGRAGRRQWQWYVLGWFFWCSSRCVPFFCRLARVVQTVQKVVQFLDQLFFARRCATTGAGFSPDCAALPVEIPQVLFLDEVMVTATGAAVQCRSSRSCSSSMVVDIPVFAQLLFPMVLIVQKTIEIPLLLVDTVADVLFVLVVQVLTCRLWVGQSSSHSSCSLRKSLCLLRSLTSLSLRRGRSPWSSLFGGP